MYEGLLHWMHPPEMENPKWNYVVLGLAALFDGGSFLVGYRQLRTVSGGQRLWRVIRTSKDPSIFTVVLEDLADLADLAGLLIAFLGIYYGQWLKNPHLDGMASVLIGLILALMAVVIMHETKGLLLGESADDDMLKAICTIAGQDRSVDKVGKPLSVYLGPHSVILAIDIQFRRDLPAVEVAAAVLRIEGLIRHSYPDVKQIFIEAKALSGRRSRALRTWPVRKRSEVGSYGPAPSAAAGREGPGAVVSTSLRRRPPSKPWDLCHVSNSGIGRPRAMP